VHGSRIGKWARIRIDHRGLLADEQVARAVQHQVRPAAQGLVGTNRIVGLVTASQIASESVAYSSAA